MKRIVHSAIRPYNFVSPRQFVYVVVGLLAQFVHGISLYQAQFAAPFPPFVAFHLVGGGDLGCTEMSSHSLVI